jgi:hypothetical protein
MSPALSWAAAALLMVAGYFAYGWPGVALAFTGVVFWLLLQYSRALRALRIANARPVGHVDSAVMLHARLHRGMTLPHIMQLTRSFGQAQPSPEGSERESFSWRDEQGDVVQVQLQRGRLSEWSLHRQAPPVG